MNSPNYKSNLNAQFSIFLLDLFFIIPLIMQLNLAEEKIRKCLAPYTTRVKSSSNHIICTEDKHVVLVLILMNPWIKFQSRMMKTSSEYDKSTPRSSLTTHRGPPPPLGGRAATPHTQRIPPPLQRGWPLCTVCRDQFP